MTTSIMPTTYNPQQFADFLKSSLADATNLHNRAVGMFGETSAQAAAAKNNMLESKK